MTEQKTLNRPLRLHDLSQSLAKLLLMDTLNCGIADAKTDGRRPWPRKFFTAIMFLLSLHHQRSRVSGAQQTLFFHEPWLRRRMAESRRLRPRVLRWQSRKLPSRGNVGLGDWICSFHLWHRIRSASARFQTGNGYGRWSRKFRAWVSQSKVTRWEMRSKVAANTIIVGGADGRAVLALEYPRVFWAQEHMHLAWRPHVTVLSFGMCRKPRRSSGRGTPYDALNRSPDILIIGSQSPSQHESHRRSSGSATWKIFARRCSQ